MSNQRSIYMLDDNASFCATAKWWLSGAGYEVFDFQEPAPLLATLAELNAEQRANACLLLDVRMPTMSGLDVHDLLLERGVAGSAGTGLPIIYMTGHGDVPLAVQAMEKGAVTFLEKPFPESALEEALDRAFKPRGSVASPSAAPDAAPQGPAHAEYARRLASLSPREAQVMQGVVAGKISKVIARELEISTKTVELHRSRVMAKMEAQSVVHLTRMAMAQEVS